MTLQELTAKMKEGASKKSAFGNTVKFATDQGVVYIDGNANPPIGNLNQNTLEEIWNNERFRHNRRMALEHAAPVETCRSCAAFGARFFEGDDPRP